MVIYSTSNGMKVYEVRSDAPSYDFTNGRAEYIVDETLPSNKTLIENIKRLSPFYQIVEDENGKIVDVLDDAEARAEWEASKPTPKEPEPDVNEILDIMLGVD